MTIEDTVTFDGSPRFMFYDAENDQVHYLRNTSTSGSVDCQLEGLATENFDDRIRADATLGVDVHFSGSLKTRYWMEVSTRDDYREDWVLESQDVDIGSTFWWVEDSVPLKYDGQTIYYMKADTKSATNQVTLSYDEIPDGKYINRDLDFEVVHGRVYDNGDIGFTWVNVEP